MDKPINQKLMSAFSELAKKDEDKISVTSLCKKADIARATFYLYYVNIDEYIDSLRNYVIGKFYLQAKEFITCEENKICYKVKKENLILNDTELSLLDYFAGGLKYIPFAMNADSIIRVGFFQEVFEKEGERYVEKNKTKLEFFLCGYIAVVYFDLIYYDEQRLLFDLKCSRELFNYLF